MAVASFLAVPAAAPAQEWKPADGPLMTRWAAEVSPDNVLPEYPRPQMVRENWTNLNGLWDYAITDGTDGDKPQEFDGQILVPFCVESALSGVMKRISPEQTLWYRRTLEAQGDLGDKRVLLHFGAVDWHAKVYLNGALVGEHKGGFDPFDFDVTDALKSGDNEHVVEVIDPTDSASSPHGKQMLTPRRITYTAVTGIWQTVWMEVVPEAHVKSLKVTPDVDAGVVKVEVDAENLDGATIRVTAGGHGLDQSVSGSDAALTIPVADAKLWSPASPTLYDLKVEIVKGGDVVDAVTSYFAMRKIEVKKDEAGHNRFYLNGEQIFSFGLLDQGWWPDGLYTAPTDAALKYDLEMTKAWGFNTSRKHVKVEPARWYYHCDQMGILVWQDMPNARNPSPKWVRTVGADAREADFPPEAAEQFRDELAEMVKDLGNFPSIILWAPFNEAWGQHDTAGTVEFIKQLDPTRLVDSASGGNFLGAGDVLDVHNYPNPIFPGLDDRQAAVCGEFGGLGLPVPGHTWQDQANWGYRTFETKEELLEAYREKLNMLPVLKGMGLAAAIYTQTTDVEKETNGLMTYDRAVVKIDPADAAPLAEQLYGPGPQVKAVMNDGRSGEAIWHYTTEQPAGEWTAADFDDYAWEQGPGGFGNTPGRDGVIGTPWTGEGIWLRRSFELDKADAEGTGELSLVIHHDDDVEVYLNGVRAYAAEQHIAEYVIVPISAEATDALRQGRNVIAVHGKQRRGGQYVDAGLIRRAGGGD